MGVIDPIEEISKVSDDLKNFAFFLLIEIFATMRSDSMPIVQNM